MSHTNDDGEGFAPQSALPAPRPLPDSRERARRVDAELQALFAAAAASATPGAPRGAARVPFDEPPGPEPQPWRGAGLAIAAVVVLFGAGSVLALQYLDRRAPPAPPAAAPALPDIALRTPEPREAPAPIAPPEAPIGFEAPFETAAIDAPSVPSPDAPDPGPSSTVAPSPDAPRPVAESRSAPPRPPRAAAASRNPTPGPRRAAAPAPRRTSAPTRPAPLRVTAPARPTASQGRCAGLGGDARIRCFYPALRAADSRLRNAYNSAADRGVPRHVLVDYRRKWDGLRGRAERDPAAVINTYQAMSRELDDEADAEGFRG